MPFVKHSVFPASSSWMTQRTWRYAGFKLIPVVSIFQEEVKVRVNMHVDDDRSVVYDVVMQILKIFLWVTEPFDPFH